MSVPGVRHINVGTADLEKTLELYVDQLGFEFLRPIAPVSSAEKRLWGVDDSIDARACTLGNAGQTHGLIRMATFGAATGDSVRGGANPYDYSPKNLDIQVADMDGLYESLTAAGYIFRSTPVRYDHHGSSIGEVQLRGPDDVNVVLLESASGPQNFNSKGVTGVTQWVLTCGDLEGTKAFFSDVIGVPVVGRNKLSGPDIERMIGLPPGAGLDIFILAGDSQHGRLELVHYEKALSQELTPRARPPRRGMLQAGFAVEDPAAMLAKLVAMGATAVAPLGPVDDCFGATGQAGSVVLPSGLMLEIWGSL